MAIGRESSRLSCCLHETTRRSKAEPRACSNLLGWGQDTRGALAPCSRFLLSRPARRDLCIEDEDECRELRRLDLEIATRDYRTQGLAEKAKAGLQDIYKIRSEEKKSLDGVTPKRRFESLVGRGHRFASDRSGEKACQC